jgi:hypothetical protein
MGGGGPSSNEGQILWYSRYKYLVHWYLSESIDRNSVADPNPDPDPHDFGPHGSGSGSISQRYGSGSGSFYHQAKKVRKTLISTAFLLFIYENYVHVPSKSNKQKN